MSPDSRIKGYDFAMLHIRIEFKKRTEYMNTLIQNTNLSEDVNGPFDCNISHPKVEGGLDSLEHGLRSFELGLDLRKLSTCSKNIFLPMKITFSSNFQI